jgi:methylthioribose-1-phosphate isomerase
VPSFASSPARAAVDRDPLPPTVEWRRGRIRLIDQRRLPDELTFIEASSVDELCAAISCLAVRGAPALGVAGAMGVALAAHLGQDVDAAAARIAATRPTAVNLSWGVERARAAADPIQEAVAMAAEDVGRNRRIGAIGVPYVKPRPRNAARWRAGSKATPSCQQRQMMRSQARASIRMAWG